MVPSSSRIKWCAAFLMSMIVNGQNLLRLLLLYRCLLPAVALEVTEHLLIDYVLQVHPQTHVRSTPPAVEQAQALAPQRRAPF